MSYIIVGILLGGIGGAMINVNHVSALVEVYKGQDLDQKFLENNASAIHTCAFGLGSIIGPIIGSVLDSTLGFRNAYGCLTILIILVMICHTTSLACAPKPIA